MQMSAPYRDADRSARFLCIVCFKSMSAYAGNCKTCGAPRLDLADPEVRDQVRLEAEKRLQRRMYREYSGIAVASAAVTAPAMFWIGGVALAYAPLLALGLSRVYAWVRRNSAIATYAARRQRISRELGVNVQIGERKSERQRSLDVPDAAIAKTSDVDPSQLEMTRLLEWLGARLDD